MADWAHAPVHRLDEEGAYMVTCGTYRKLHHLSTPARLDFFLDRFFTLAKGFGWQLQAWAILANHYHFVAVSPGNAQSLSDFLKQLHEETAEELNRHDRTPGRQVWFQFRDTHLTYPRSYYARLKYVHNNPARHGVVVDSAEYRWCSKPWFDQTATNALKRTVSSFRTDQLRVPDDF